MSRTTNDLVRIAAAGGGVSIDAATMTTDQLVQVVAASNAKSGSIIVRNASTKTTDDLVCIAAAGSGNTVFEL